MTQTSDIKSAPAYRIKLAANNQTGAFEGYASVAGNVDSYGDIVEPGAFRASLDAHKAAGTSPLMLWQHSPDRPCGRWTSLAEDSTGLYVKGQMNLDTSWGRDAWAALRDDNVNGLSIGYRVVKSRPEGVLRRLDAVELMEVSVVSFPANGAARVTLTSKRELETILTKSGLSNAAAAKIASGGWSALVGDSADEPDTIKALTDAVSASTLRIRNLTNGR